MMNKTKTILLWVMIAGIAGCVYDVDRSMYDYPVRVSSECALRPNTRWTSLHYCGCRKGGTVVSMEISRDSHKVLFLRYDLWYENRSPTLYDGTVTPDKWNWIVSQLEQAGVFRWKELYLPERFEDIRDERWWLLEFLDGTNVVGKAEGCSVWPNCWDAFQSILDSFDVVQKVK